MVTVEPNATFPVFEVPDTVPAVIAELACLMVATPLSDTFTDIPFEPIIVLAEITSVISETLI